MIDPEVAVQLKALSEENQSLREDISALSQRIDGNNANIAAHVESELAKLRDPVLRAIDTVTRFDGTLQVFTDQQGHFKTEFAWWEAHLGLLERRAEATIKKMVEAEARLELDNSSFKEWAMTKITQIGRIFRR